MFQYKKIFFLSLSLLHTSPLIRKWARWARSNCHRYKWNSEKKFLNVTSWSTWLMRDRRKKRTSWVRRNINTYTMFFFDRKIDRILQLSTEILSDNVMVIKKHEKQIYVNLALYEFSIMKIVDSFQEHFSSIIVYGNSPNVYVIFGSLQIAWHVQHRYWIS